MVPDYVPIETIHLDGNTQPRCKIDESHVVDLMAQPAWIETHPLIVYFDGIEYWLADGFHRYHALGRLGKNRALCRVYKGAQRDAMLFSVGANHDHGLKRTNGDKRKAVLTLLQDEEWGGRSNTWISDHCHVSEYLVEQLRRENPTLRKPALTGRDGRVLPAAYAAGGGGGGQENYQAKLEKEVMPDAPDAPEEVIDYHDAFSQLFGALELLFGRFPKEFTAAILPRVEELRHHTLTMLGECVEP